MKKIIFNDKYGLTDVVLQRRKTMTRRICKDKASGAIIYAQDVDSMRLYAEDGIAEFVLKRGEIMVSVMPYEVGEEVAVAQSYKTFLNALPDRIKEQVIGYYAGSKAWSNKMFVRADLMPHQIRITDIKVERLQDISDEDVYREGFNKEFINNGWGNAAFHEEAVLVYYDKLGLTKTFRSIYPKDAFAALIDKVSGKGTWESNPWVFAYGFELCK